MRLASWPIVHPVEGSDAPHSFKTMNRFYEGYRESPYLAKLEADRQAQHSGYGVRSVHMADGTKRWEAYTWERITELQLLSTSISELFDHQWQAEHFINLLLHR
jgi:hypothetical protein